MGQDHRKCVKKNLYIGCPFEGCQKKENQHKSYWNCSQGNDVVQICQHANIICDCYYDNIMKWKFSCNNHQGYAYPKKENIQKELAAVLNAINVDMASSKDQILWCKELEQSINNLPLSN